MLSHCCRHLFDRMHELTYITVHCTEPPFPFPVARSLELEEPPPWTLCLKPARMAKRMVDQASSSSAVRVSNSSGNPSISPISERGVNEGRTSLCLGHMSKQPQHSIYNSPRQFRQSLQQWHSFNLHWQLWVIRHLETTDPQTTSLHPSSLATDGPGTNATISRRKMMVWDRSCILVEISGSNDTLCIIAARLYISVSQISSIINTQMVR